MSWRIAHRRWARRAEAEGNGEEMRRLYARFLLQQKQIPPALQQVVVEAYLKLGDSYRLEAQAATEKARIEELQELKATLETLVEACHGDERPDCPILDDLAFGDRARYLMRGTGRTARAAHQHCHPRALGSMLRLT